MPSHSIIGASVFEHHLLGLFAESLNQYCLKLTRVMEVAWAVDSHFVGDDIGNVSSSFSSLES
jgi:hypothetical protein